jgi:hypothetical protein
MPTTSPVPSRMTLPEINKCSPRWALRTRPEAARAAADFLNNAVSLTLAAEVFARYGLDEQLREHQLLPA